MKLKKGRVHIYTGKGKGKTTAALGLALRASGAGLSVYMLQFIKKAPYSEIKALRKISNITLEQCGRGCFIGKKPAKPDIEYAHRGLARAGKALVSGRYDLVILDEANVALELRLLEIKNLVDLIKSKSPRVELVLTGRGCPGTLYRYADLVTEMKEKKHYFRKGIKARRGIEF